MFFLYLLLCCIASSYASDRRTVQCILGRNVSFSFTFSNINRDAIVIFHNSSLFLRGLPMKNQFLLHRQDERVRIDVDKSNYNTFTVTVSIMNVTENDAGIYKMVQNWSSKDVIDSVAVQTFATFPWIKMVPKEIQDSAIVLQCNSFTASTEKILWKLNGSVIESHSRYTQNSAFLSFKNVTSDDKHNLYTCKEFESGLESDSYKLNISGPNVITFSANVTVAKEHEWLNISCFADCYPICTWKWSKLDLSSAPEKVSSVDNELKLNNITREDAGGYCCTVYNIITNTSLEGVTYLDVVYGPDEIYINTSDTTIQLEEFETITLFCYTDCFPPCQTFWIETNTKTPRPGSELKLMHVDNDFNYRCHAINPRTSKVIISKTIYVKVTSGTTYYKTTGIIPGNPKEDLPSTRYFLYVTLGVGLIVCIGVFSCLLHKARTCSHVRRASNNTLVTSSNQDRRDETPEQESSSGNYWTIVSNERGEMSTAPEICFKQRNMPALKDITKVPKQNDSEQSISDIAIDLDEYMDPVHSGAKEHDDYIHPVHSAPINTDFSPNHHTL